MTVSERAHRPSVLRWAQSRAQGRVGAQTFIIVAAIAVIAYLALVPLIYLLAGTFTTAEGTFTLENFQRAYAHGGLLDLLGNSLLYAAGATALSMFLGTALAYLTARTDVPLRGLVYAAALVPLIIPGILHTISWIFLASPQIGILNSFLAPVFGPGFLNVFSMWGMIFVQGVHTSPIVFLLMYAAFRSMDPSLEESALMSGASLPRVLAQVTVPLVKPALYLAIVIMGIRGLESFEVPALLGGSAGIWVFTSRIYDVLTTFPPGYGQAGAYALSLLAILIFGVWWQSQLQRRSRSFQTVSGKGFRPRSISLGRLRGVIGALVGLYFVVAVVLPISVLLYVSLQEFYITPTAASLQSLSIKNYGLVFTDPDSLRALKNSLLLSLGSATAVMLLMAVVAWVVVRSKLMGRRLVGALTFVPMGVPGLILGVSLLFLYLRVPIPIYGSIWILFIAYVTIYMPFGMTYATASMYQISGELEESAQTCGASWWYTFRTVYLPLLMPGLLAGWIFIVLTSVRELSSSLLLYTPGNEVLSVLIWEHWGRGRLTQLAALGVVMITMLVVIVLVARKLGARVGVQSH